MNQIMKADLHTYISNASENIEVVRNILKELSEENKSNVYILMDKSFDPQSLYIYGQEFVPNFWRELYIEALKDNLRDAHSQANDIDGAATDWDWSEIEGMVADRLKQMGIDADKVIEEWESEHT